MWTQDDLFRIMNWIKDDIDDNLLDPNTKALSKAEQQSAENLFTSTIDQTVFITDDYKRARKLLRDWYASHRTMTTTQKNISDLYSLPEKHINELFRSFGYNYASYTIKPVQAKVNLFLDLVNIYKKKGTPGAIKAVLDYYGYSGADLVEYSLMYNSSGNLIFRPEAIARATFITGIAGEDISFNSMVSGDPHWMLTYEQVQIQTLQNLITLPSKSPYFSFGSNFSLERLNVSISIIRRIIQDQYDEWLINPSSLPPNDVYIQNLGIEVSLLEAWLSYVYAYNRKYTPPTPIGPNLFFYTGLVPTYYENIITDYENLTTSPQSREERELNIPIFQSLFTTELANYILSDLNAAEGILTTINLSLKTELDGWFDIGEGDDLIKFLMQSLDLWIRDNIDTKAASLVITKLGYNIGQSDINKAVKEIISFLKPYRARLKSIDIGYAISNPLLDTLIIDDELLVIIPEVSFYDTEYVIDVFDYMVYRLYPVGDIRWNFHDTEWKSNLTALEDINPGYSQYSTGGMSPGFDSGDAPGGEEMYFDKPQGSDVCFINVIQLVSMNGNSDIDSSVGTGYTYNTGVLCNSGAVNNISDIPVSLFVV